jgi:hypothetical protein
MCCIYLAQARKNIAAPVYSKSFISQFCACTLRREKKTSKRFAAANDISRDSNVMLHCRIKFFQPQKCMCREVQQARITDNYLLMMFCANAKLQVRQLCTGVCSHAHFPP